MAKSRSKNPGASESGRKKSGDKQKAVVPAPKSSARPSRPSKRANREPVADVAPPAKRPSTAPVATPTGARSTAKKPAAAPAAHAKAPPPKASPPKASPAKKGGAKSAPARDPVRSSVKPEKKRALRNRVPDPSPEAVRPALVDLPASPPSPAAKPAPKPEAPPRPSAPRTPTANAFVAESSPRPESVTAPVVERPAEARPVAPPISPAPRFGDEEGWTALSDSEGGAAEGDDDDDDDFEDDELEDAGPAGRPPAAATGSEEGWVTLSEEEADAPPSARRAIPPLPDEDDVFEPIESDDEGPPREPPPGATPHDVLKGVRRGTLHVSALNSIPDEMIEALADDEGLAPATGERRADLLRRLLEHRIPEPARPPVEVEGLLELLPEGFGFIRRAEYGYVRATSDPFVPPNFVRELALSTGHWLAAKARPPRSDEKYPEIVEILGVNHEEPTSARELAPFDSLVVTHPDHRFILETEPEQVSMRIMDLFCPLGRGQRALVVSPPRAGKTILLQGIADSLARNSPEVDIVVLLVDERPEEVTNMRRSIRGEVFASTFDQPAHRHIRLAELVLEKVKRMVEFGRHVVLLLDSLTRLGRAYNNESADGGRLLTGGLDASALTKPKAFFGAARNIEHGGSLTIVASALVDTGSRLDQVIFEEFKGTGNMEIALSRDLAYRRLWPAIDIPKSGTRKEDLLLHPEELRRITVLRRAMAGQEAPEVLTDLLYKMEKHRTNAEFLMMVQG